MTRIQFVAPLLALAVVSGCDSCMNGISNEVLTCAVSGGATFTSDADGVTMPVRVDKPFACSPASEACAAIQLYVTTTGPAAGSAPGGGDLGLGISNELRGRVTLPSPMVSVSGAEAYDPTIRASAPLRLVDGQVDLESSDDAHYTVAFTIRLQDDANNSFTFTGGQAKVDCELTYGCIVPSN
jgi:hypothetical protein